MSGLFGGLAIPVILGSDLQNILCDSPVFQFIWRPGKVTHMVATKCPGKNMSVPSPKIPTLLVLTENVGLQLMNTLKQKRIYLCRNI